MMFSFQATLGRNTFIQQLMFTKLCQVRLSVKFAKYYVASSNQEFLGMIGNDTEIKSAASKLETIARILVSTDVEQLSSFSELTGHLHNFVLDYSIITAPLVDLLRNDAFSSKRARKIPIKWSHMVRWHLNTSRDLWLTCSSSRSFV